MGGAFVTWPPPAGLTALRQTGPDAFRYGRPGPLWRVEEWRHAREHLRDEVCELCWKPIPKFTPGHTSGTRGTKAFYEPVLRLWRHRECHERRQAWERAA